MIELNALKNIDLQELSQEINENTFVGPPVDLYICPPYLPYYSEITADMQWYLETGNYIDDRPYFND